MMLREVVAKQFNLTDCEQVDLIGQVKYAGREWHGFLPSVSRETSPSI